MPPLNLIQLKGPLILLCQIISVECPTNLNFPLLTSNQNKGSPKQPISMKGGSKFVGHFTEIIRQSKIKGPLKARVEIKISKKYSTLMIILLCHLWAV